MNPATNQTTIAQGLRLLACGCPFGPQNHRKIIVKFL
jgi:hypothetical protein